MLDFSLNGGRLNRWRLFLMMGSEIGTVWVTFRSFTYVSYLSRLSFSIWNTVSATADYAMFLSFGAGKSFRFLVCHEMTRALSSDWCIALPTFHVSTECDTVSCFARRGKRTAWDTWNAYGNVTPAFCALVARPILQSLQEWLAPVE